MSSAFDFLADEIVIACREWLAARDVPADEIPDEEVIPRVRARLIRLCVTGHARFIRHMADYPTDRRLTERPLAMIDLLWVHYRRVVRELPPTVWPMGLPRPPASKPGGVGPLPEVKGLLPAESERGDY